MSQDLPETVMAGSAPVSPASSEGKAAQQGEEEGSDGVAHSRVERDLLTEAQRLWLQDKAVSSPRTSALALTEAAAAPGSPGGAVSTDGPASATDALAETPAEDCRSRQE